jgi:hypothetical protein
MKQHYRWWKIWTWRLFFFGKCRWWRIVNCKCLHSGNNNRVATNSPECDRTYWWRHMHFPQVRSWRCSYLLKGKFYGYIPQNKLKQESLNLAPKKSRYGTKLVLLIHESSHNLQTVSKSPKLTSSWLPIFKCEIIRHTKIQVPRSNFPTSSTAMHPWKQD